MLISQRKNLMKCIIGIAQKSFEYSFYISDSPGDRDFASKC